MSSTASGGDALKVFVRVRPPLPRESADDCVVIADDDAKVVSVVEPAKAKNSSRARAHEAHQFAFDGVFAPDAAQSDIFETAVVPQVEACLQGFNSTVFCYGPSGTGKSYTCYGPEGAVGGVIDAATTPRKHTSAARWAGSPEAGLIPRAAAQLFGAIERARHGRFLLRVSFVQLYRENLSDLLAPASGALHIREDPSRGVFVEGLTEVAVRSPHDAWALAARGQRQRTTAATRLNDVSSRSHALFTMIVEQAGGSTGTAGEAKKGDTTASSALKLSRLNLVDLAGSERAALMGESGDRLEESKKINLSLSALAKVMATLCEASGKAGGKVGHVPYRDSKLTRMLQDSLGASPRNSAQFGAILRSCLTAAPPPFQAATSARR